MIQQDFHMPQVSPQDVARILGAMGQLMDQLHACDLALQDAVSDITSTAAGVPTDFSHLQHIDLVTQTHADLARFLPQLADCLVGHPVHQKKLAGALTLHSLQNLLLGLVSTTSEDEVEAGELSLF